MKVVAYCRVSTNKEEQLDSMDSQQRFFTEYSSRNGYELVKIYADEGKSGTKMKNRPQLLKLLSDARKNLFQLVLIKDVSRLARNTLDFLTSVRSLKALQIKVIFVNYDQTSSDSSEFMLTMLSAIAQEESANTSKRIKFGKRQNAEHGRVPNLVYGYDKSNGDYFNLSINEKEAEIINRIFVMYCQENMGASRIARVLNQEGIKTKRGYIWSQNAISRILSNEIYIGHIINGKQEVEDFLTGKRKDREQAKWLVVERPELSIVDERTFYKTKSILERRKASFHETGKKLSNKNMFSQLLHCKQCGSTYRRLVRTYKKTYITWVCNGRNSNGTGFCENTTTIDEDEMLNSIIDYFVTILSSKPAIVQNIERDYYRQLIDKDENRIFEKDYKARLKKLVKEKQKYMEMYTNDVITIEDLKERTKSINKEIEYYQNELRTLENHTNRSGCSIKNFQTELLSESNNIGRILKPEFMTNEILKGMIRNIDIDKKGNVDVYLKSLE